jgi:hypothetical protein
VIVSERARRNREYVRRLLEEKDPEFAAALAEAVHELSRCTGRRDETVAASTGQRVADG